MFKKTIGYLDFIAPSKTKNKKYDVYDNISGKKIASFGDIRFQHYFDKLGFYSDLNHLDEKRRENYRKRHRNDKLDKLSAGFFSYNFLW